MQYTNERRRIVSMSPEGERQTSLFDEYMRLCPNLESAAALFQLFHTYTISPDVTSVQRYVMRKARDELFRSSN